MKSKQSDSRRGRLTESDIRRSRPGDVLRDDVIPGLQLRAFPTRKTFYLYYRTTAGRERRRRLGTAGALTVVDARKVRGPY